ncbi:3-hydroxyacyl-ACP dehydratase FabZ [Aquihabitans daechungensis]|uniref:3-hydroxyacyl-ACP dehydratase FabZ n=1 Tax=Aquihabitans daechungensis TaxID=1052257 RepID=UPI003BA21C03
MSLIDPTGSLVALLPHRPPFRFVDAVDACEPGRSVSARWRIAGSETWLAGHFPGNPVVPGVLQLEALAQAGAVALLADPVHAGRLPLFGGVEDVRFRGQVRPGDELHLDVVIERVGGRGGWGRGRATVEGSEVCSGRLLFVIVDRPEVPSA